MLLAYTDGLSEDLYPIACTHGQRCLTQLGQASTDLTGVLTGAIDMATSAVPLHAFADDISLLALRPRTALPPERHVIVAGDVYKRQGSAISFGHEAAAILGLEHDSAVMGWQEMMAGFPAEERPAIIAAWSQGFSGSQTIEIDAWWTHHGRCV